MLGLEGPASRFGHAASEPVGAWPDTAFRPTTMSAERAPWVAPPEARGGLVKRRGVQALLAVGLLGAAIAVLAIATGAWDQMPQISLGTGNDASTRATSIPPAIDPPAATAKPAEPAPLGNALPTNATAELPAVASPPTSSTAAPAPAPAPTPTPSDTATTDMAATPTPDADKIEAAPAKAEVAPPTAREKAAPSAALPTRSPATVPAPAPAATPRAACAGRTEFALYRCMQQQCQAQRFASHPQCVLLRRDDKVQ